MARQTTALIAHVVFQPLFFLSLFFGSEALAYAGEAERAVDWAERALRISPFDRMNYLSYHALALAHFLRGRYDQAAHPAPAVGLPPSYRLANIALPRRW